MKTETLERSPSTKRGLSTIELHSPTAWPIILAFGLTLVFAGLVTSASVSILGAVFTVVGCVGWFREVLPHEKHEGLASMEGVPRAETRRPRVARVECKTGELNRARLPLEIYPITAVVKGGWSGSIAMAILDVLGGI